MQRIIKLGLWLGAVALLNGCSGTLSPKAVGSVLQAPKQTPLPSSIVGLAETTSFDVEVDKGRIHLIAVGTLPNGDKQPVIRYVFSDDGGQQWSPPSTVLSPKPPSMVTRGNDIQLAVTGDKLVALWQTTGELPGMGPLVSVYSHDGGQTWQAGSNPAAKDDGDQSHSDMVATDKGVFHAVWLDDRDENGYQGLRYARSEDAGIHWQKSVTLDDSTCSCCWNKIALTPHGALNVLYRDMDVRDMALIQSTDQGASWQKSSKVGDFNWKFEGCPHVGGSIAYTQVDNSITLHSVVWTGLEQKQGLYYLKSSDNAKQWSTPYKIGQRSIHGDIATRDNQSIRIVWDENGEEGSSVYSAQSVDGGLSWSEAKPWSMPGHNASHPRIVSSPTGFLLLWTEKYAEQPTQLVSIVVK